MGWGMYLNNVYLSRVLRKNLNATIMEAQELKDFLRERLIALVAATPMPTDNESAFHDHETVQVVNEILGEYEDAAWQFALATHAREFPDDVVADDDPATEETTE